MFSYKIVFSADITLDLYYNVQLLECIPCCHNLIFVFAAE